MAQFDAGAPARARGEEPPRHEDRRQGQAPAGRDLRRAEEEDPAAAQPVAAEGVADVFQSGRRMSPLAVDLFCGLGGWTEGLLAEGYDVIGFDIERHVYGEHSYPAQLVVQDVLTLHGSQFVDAALIVASPPCQAYSYRAMPWKRAKVLPPPDNTLFEACFRIAQEAGVPIVVENVKGAQKWVGRAKWHYGSFYLWGDVPALMPFSKHRKGAAPIGKAPGDGYREENGTKHDESGWRPNGTLKSNNRMVPDGTKQGGDWFGLGEDCSMSRRFSSRSNSRKAASPAIAKIPFILAQWIAKVYHP